eukprot:2426857-Pyramimonas_sp.AAC.1
MQARLRLLAYFPQSPPHMKRNAAHETTRRTPCGACVLATDPGLADWASVWGDGGAVGGAECEGPPCGEQAGGAADVLGEGAAGGQEDGLP